MADVDMTDAPASAPLVKKKGAAGDAESNGGKKRFEVKKVCCSLSGWYCRSEAKASSR
jgi:hypothetical protein